MPTWPRLPFWQVVVLLGVLAAAGVGALTAAGFGFASLGFLAVPMALAVWYLVATHVSAPPPPVTAEDEPFEDPVELADREDRARQSSAEPGAAPQPTTVETDPVS